MDAKQTIPFGDRFMLGNPTWLGLETLATTSNVGEIPHLLPRTNHGV